MYQKVLLIGNLGNTPTLRKLPSGMDVVNFSVATNKRTKYNDKVFDSHVWWNVEILGTIAPYHAHKLEKGDRVFLEGYLRAAADGNPEVFTKRNGEAASKIVLRANLCLHLRQDQPDLDVEPDFEKVDGDPPSKQGNVSQANEPDEWDEIPF